mgnify:FL=1
MMEIGSGSMREVSIVEIGSNSLNSVDSNTLDLRSFVSVERVEIGRNSLENVESIVVNSIPSLIELSVDSNSLSS